MNIHIHSDQYTAFHQNITFNVKVVLLNKAIMTVPEPSTDVRNK